MPSAQGLVSLDVDPRQQRKLERAIDRLPDRVFWKVVGQAAGYAMGLVVSGARRRVRRRTGTLWKSLGKKRRMYNRSGVVVVIVGPRKGFRDPTTGEDPVNIAHLVEFGAAPHVIETGRGARIDDPKNPPPRWVRGIIQHPGAKAQPFMRPALTENARGVLVRYRGRLLQGVERETVKLRSGG